jgi:hypothetical protein
MLHSICLGEFDFLLMPTLASLPRPSVPLDGAKFLADAMLVSLRVQFVGTSGASRSVRKYARLDTAVCSSCSRQSPF